ncbi:molybdate ABC transporter substrate-binding protein [Tessaracoccus terricola]
MSRGPRLVGAALLAAALLGATACSAAEEAAPVVFAAASLTNPFEELADDAAEPADFSFGGSNGLVDQLVGGAPADVFASANTSTMDRAVEEGVIEGEPVRFATNVLVLVTPAGNPAGITGLDQSLDGAKLVVCAPEVPCGEATAALAETVGITLQPVSEESAVTDVLGKVTSGEADAGLVYATDAAGAGEDVETIEIPESSQHVNEYWIAAVVGGDAEAAASFIGLVTGQQGQDLLVEFGFGPS